MLPLVRLPLRLDCPTYVSGEQILKALKNLAEERGYRLEVKLEKYYEEGQYHSLKLKHGKSGNEFIDVLISEGEHIDSAKNEINLQKEYNSWYVYVENDRLDCFSDRPSDEKVVAAVKEVRNLLVVALRKYL